ncbi:sulfate reduction electron transfer complex DsrMKJOP subunit DsrK [Magnetospirillum sp. UT-4]|uniref:sulfate reduction electron transfer complex DsrMKJOP subunit DsrK n=1 Tax=Magnetospirillum sp. UT-4 TaxID=2681467 RepID=UPI001385ECCB|nr:(Fe-S)-binding protein [Magnetospirillum sp. UT-4]CAA7620849.1 Hdr-like menaquinol oxidoreductase iron-sulfur subunit 2 [Magnetospirillum sp. UT-4]
MADIQIPVLGDPDQREIPSLIPGAMAGSKPYVAQPPHQEPLGFPGELVPDWQEKALGRMGDLLSKYRSLQVYMDICVKCGACTDKCHYFLGTGDPKNMPVARQDLFRSVYRRYFTPAGKMLGAVGLGGLIGAKEFTKDLLDEWFNYFHQCSQCRRCSVFCPYGIDTAEVSMAAREIMDSIGYGQKYCNEIIGKVHKIGNNLGLPGPALIDNLEGLEEDMKDETGQDVRFPIDEEGAEVLLVTPSADFFAEPHVLGLIGYAKVFHGAGISWTLSTKATEAGNFGMFIGNYEQMRKIAMRIREAAIELKVKRIVFGECGHAWRVAYSFLTTLVGPWDFLDPRYPVPQHILEVTNGLIKKGGIKLDKSGNDKMVLTVHDSCNVARASRMGDFPGGQFVIPREVIKSCVPKFVDMHPDTTHEKTFCCGGGGGLLTDELMDIRVKGAKPRMEALKDVVDNQGVTHMASMCAICKAQFTKVLPYYGYDREMVVSVHQLVSNAIILGNND